MIRCYILRTNNTIKKTRVRESKDSFDFENGKYFVMSDKVMLYKGLIFFKPFLFYKEGYSEPICFDNVKKVKTHDKKGKPLLDKDGKPKADEDTVLIDATSIHNLTSRELLDVLSKASLSKVEIILIILVILSIIISAVGVGLSAQIQQSI